MVQKLGLVKGIDQVARFSGGDLSSFSSAWVCGERDRARYGRNLGDIMAQECAERLAAPRWVRDRRGSGLFPLASVEDPIENGQEDVVAASETTVM